MEGGLQVSYVLAQGVCVCMHAVPVCCAHASDVHLEARGPYCLCDRVSSLTLKLALAGWPVSARIQDPAVLSTSPTPVVIASSVPLHFFKNMLPGNSNSISHTGFLTSRWCVLGSLVVQAFSPAQVQGFNPAIRNQSDPSNLRYLGADSEIQIRE